MHYFLYKYPVIFLGEVQDYLFLEEVDKQINTQQLFTKSISLCQREKTLEEGKNA